MTAIAFPLLFAAAGLFAVLSIALGLFRFAPAALRLRQALSACPIARELRFAITELHVEFAEEANVLRPDFAARARTTARLQPAPLRAAA
jgi:hypothetical protein